MECAEANKTHFVALFEFSRNHIENRVNDGACLRFREIRDVGNGCDQIALVHVQNSNSVRRRIAAPSCATFQK
jgi:hypothetical protein